MQPSPNAVINIGLAPNPLSDDEIAEFVTKFIQTFPTTVGAWGPWQTTETANGDYGEDWLHDWPDDIEEQTKIVRSSAFTDSFGKRRGETGSFVQLKREFKHEDLGTNYCWEARFCIGYAGLPGVSNAISLAVPTADQKQGCTTSVIRDYLEIMIENTAPTWANLRDMRFARKLRESGFGRWVEGRIPSAWMTFVSWNEIEARRIDVDKISRLVEVDTREDGIMAKVPGPFEDPDMEIAVKLSDLTQMPQNS